MKMPAGSSPMPLPPQPSGMPGMMNTMPISPLGGSSMPSMNTLPLQQGNFANPFFPTNSGQGGPQQGRGWRRDGFQGGFAGGLPPGLAALFQAMQGAHGGGGGMQMALPNQGFQAMPSMPTLPQPAFPAMQNRPMGMGGFRFGGG